MKLVLKSLIYVYFSCSVLQTTFTSVSVLLIFFFNFKQRRPTDKACVT